MSTTEAPTLRVVEMRAPTITTEYDSFGGVDVKVDGWTYVHINYDHRYTDNAARASLADKIAAMLSGAALAATSAPSEPAMTEAEDKLHAAICHAVSIMNNSFDIARSTEGREAKDILRRALLDYADALSAAPAVRIFDDRPQLERLAKAEHAMRNPPKLEFEDERAQPEAPAEPIDGALMTDVLGYLRSSQNFKLATRLSEALATPPAEVVVPAELSDAEIEELRKATFSTENPFCPVDAKSMRKAVRATERFLAKSKEKAS